LFLKKELIYIRSDFSWLARYMGHKNILLIELVERIVALFPIVGHLWTELGKQILNVLSFLFYRLYHLWLLFISCWFWLPFFCPTYQVLTVSLSRIQNNLRPPWGNQNKLSEHHEFQVGDQGTFRRQFWIVESEGGNNFNVRMVDKTWSVVIRCLRDKELMEIAKEKVILERWW
jgi:hypothetical protein